MSRKGLLQPPVQPSDATHSSRTTQASIRTHFQRALGDQHEVVPVLNPVNWTGSPSTANTHGEFLSLRRAYRKIMGQRTRSVYVTNPVRLTEASLVQAGFRVILEQPGLNSARPRRAARFAGQMGSGIVIPPADFLDNCPRGVPIHWTPAAADRATRAIRTASTESPPIVVRVSVLGDDSTPEHLETLFQWLDQVVLPADVHFSIPRLIHRRMGRLIDHPNLDAQTSTTSVHNTGGRLIPVHDIRTAAASLTSVQELPRRLPGDLNLSEAFMAFTRLLAGDVEDSVVRLSKTTGPASLAISQIPSVEIAVPRAAIIQLAKIIRTAPPERLPSSFRIDGRLFTAAETLLLLAGAVRGEDAPKTWLVLVPDPRATGLGWGEATTP